MPEIRALGLDGVFELTPRKFDDDRGFFSETYNAAVLAANGIKTTFVQDNHSYSADVGTLRGLHYQLPPRAQVKLVRVVRGRVFDVVVDLREQSPTFAKWLGIELSAATGNQILVPVGFAHGFLTLEPDTEVSYKVGDFYSPDHERAVRFDDPEIAIDWPANVGRLRISTKDQRAPLLANAAVFAGAA